MAGATTLGDLASALDVRTAEASIVAELKAGSEDAFYWLIAHYNQPVYSLVYRILDDPSDAADTTQEVFIKVFRGIKNFNADSSLKTWIYRIAVHEASNHRRWWFRHKVQETSIEPASGDGAQGSAGAFARHRRTVLRANRRGDGCLAGYGEVTAGTRTRGAAKTHGASPAGFRDGPGRGAQSKTPQGRPSCWSEG